MDLGSRIHKRNQNFRFSNPRGRTITASSDELEKLAFSDLTIREVPIIAPKSRNLSDPVGAKRARTKTVRISAPAEQRPPPIRTNAPWPLFGVENLGSAGSAPMDISAGSSAKTAESWPKEQDQLNLKSSKSQEKLTPSPPPRTSLAGGIGAYDSVGYSLAASPDMIFYPVWEFADPSYPNQGWVLKGYVYAYRG